ncbi:hypothetical protein [Streptomyces sp. NPDC052496]|uniref:hypothetical protein n=1 Tax=Streptomyces sp. NPDC052496 TaxID=3154951 RepID=UPI0034131D1C
MNEDREWWAGQRRLAENTITRFEQQQISLKGLVDDLLFFSDAFAERGTESMDSFSSQLPVPARQWLEMFQSAALGVEVIFSVADHAEQEHLSGEDAASVDEEVTILKNLISALPG